MEILIKAARRECPECGGPAIVADTGNPTDGYVACPACDMTGLWIPELSGGCPFNRETHNDHAMFDPQIDEASQLRCCHGTGRILILNDPERLDAASRRLGATYGMWWCISDEWYGYSYDGTEGVGGTVLEARQAALAKVIKEMENESGTN